MALKYFHLATSMIVSKEAVRYEFEYFSFPQSACLR